VSAPAADARLLRTGFILEWVTLAWNVVGVLVLAWLAITSSSTPAAASVARSRGSVSIRPVAGSTR